MKSRTRGSIAVGAIAAAGAIALVVWRSVAVEAAYPVENARRTLATRVWSRVTGAFRGAAASAENVRLKRELAALAMLRGDLERLEAENVRLRRGLALSEREPGSWIAAEVLATDGGAAGVRTFLRINRGELDDVSKGAVVACPDGLVGRVASTTAHTAAVTPLTDPSVKAHCRVEGDGRVRGILSGGADEALVLRSLAGDFAGAGSPAPRSRVVTSGLGGVFPPGLEVGAWVRLCTNANGTATGEVLPSVSFSELEEVFVRRGQ